MVGKKMKLSGEKTIMKTFCALALISPVAIDISFLQSRLMKYSFLPSYQVP
jgi:hypothetical protein